MDRRTFLSATALGSGALITGCGGAMPRIELAPGEERELLARLERGLSTIRTQPTGAFAREMRGHARPDLSERILRLGLEALVVVDVTRSIPHGASLAPALADSLAPELPIVDRYTSTYHALLGGMPHRARVRVASKVRERPDLPMDVAEWLDGHASRLGMAPESRGQLRGVASQLGTRMRRQSVNAVIDDCIAKVDRVIAQGGGQASHARAQQTSAMFAAIWQEIEVPPAPGSPGGALASPYGVAPPVSEEDLDRDWEQVTRSDAGLWSAQWARPGDEERLIGSIMMPFGAITCGLLLIVGFIVWIAGMVQNGEWDGTPRAEQ